MTQLRRSILCIEDERETAALIEEELSERGYYVDIAYDGVEGLAAILRDPPDLVLCNIRVLKMSGFEVLERLNAIAPRLGHVPFIFLTALSDGDNELGGRPLGVDDFVTKPIDFKILVTIINARLARIAREGVWPKNVSLSPREAQVLTLVARGKTSSEIAKLLGTSKRTIDYHVENARAKLRASTRTEAATKAAIGKLIEP